MTRFPLAATTARGIVAIVLFDLPPAFEPAARGSAGKRFIVRTWALTDGDEIAVADSRPVTLFTARKLEVRARKSDALDVEVYPADEQPPMPTDAKPIRLLVGIQITTEPDLFDLMRSRAREAEHNQRIASSSASDGGKLDER